MGASEYMTAARLIERLKQVEPNTRIGVVWECGRKELCVFEDDVEETICLGLPFLLIGDNEIQGG